MIETIRKFFTFAGNYRRDLQKGIFYTVLDSLFHALQIMAIFVVLDDLASNTINGSTALTSFVIMLVSMIGAIITKNASIMAEARGSFYMCADKRTQIGNRMKYMPMGYFNANSLGDITATVTSTMEDIQDIAPRVLDKTIHGFVHAAMVTLTLFIFDWRMGLISLGGILLFIGVNICMQIIFHKKAPARVAAQTALVGAVLEYVQGIGVVRSFNRVQAAGKTIDRAIDECERHNVGLELSYMPLMALQSLILKWTSVVIFITAVQFYLAGTMELQVCLLMLVSAFILYNQIETAGSMSALLRAINVSMDRVNAIFQMPVMDAAGRTLIPETRSIRGSHVTFAYEKKAVINDIDFDISPKETIAIVGPSGGGKTTFCNLLVRFWDPDAGDIFLGGKSIREYTIDSLLENFSMVFQRVYLFNDTIANNIRFGKPDADMDAIHEAARKACCHDFIMQLPDGYETLVGEGGATLSGGEKQRLSIARAILKDAPIIILDEATANVDPENENQLQAAIAELTRKKTVIMIAHRLKTVRGADQIWVLDQGRIVQRGSHEDLMKTPGLYADFVHMRKQSIGWKLGRDRTKSPTEEC